MPFDSSAVAELIRLAIREDLGDGDVTSEACVPESASATGAFVMREAGVLAGLPAARLVYAEVSADVTVEEIASDGDLLEAGSVVARVAGAARAVLAGERIALNFMQRMSGIASATRECVEAVKGYGCLVQETRKTVPGWRWLDKYAVRMGGGANHRMGLHDQVLIKDNHLRLAAACAPEGTDPIAHAVSLARRRVGATMEVEVECDTPRQVEAALAAGADIVMLDNMTDDQMRACAARVRAARNARNASRPVTEASGGLVPERLAAVAATGVDRISLGALTHSVRALDIALDLD